VGALPTTTAPVMASALGGQVGNGSTVKSGRPERRFEEVDERGSRRQLLSQGILFAVAGRQRYGDRMPVKYNG